MNRTDLTSALSAVMAKSANEHADTHDRRITDARYYRSTDREWSLMGIVLGLLLAVVVYQWADWL